MNDQQVSSPSASEHAIPWYKQPAKTWNEALPVGNGRLGSVVYGRTATELLQLNEDSVYNGGRQDRTPKHSRANLPRLRHLIRKGEHELAEELVDLTFVPMPSCQRHYEPLASIKMNFGHDEPDITGYRRSLDLLKGVASVKYEYKGVEWHRELIASYEHDVMLMKVRSSKATKYSLRMSRLSENEWDSNEFYDIMETTDDSIIMRFGSGIAGTVQSCCAVAACCDTQGSISMLGGTIVIEAREAHLIIAARSSFRHDDPTLAARLDIDKAIQADPARIWEAHVDSHYEATTGMRLTLFEKDELQENQRPTDQRIDSSARAGLVELYHNHGRYLLKSSSRPSLIETALSLPSNLQGIWNPSFSPPWGCRFTININTQMNYWPCHIWDLSASSDPLFYLLLRMADRGRKTAAEMYGCKRSGAWCAHHNTDPWADTDPVDRWMPSTLWPLGGTWLCLHIWERYEFEGDADRLGGESFLDKMHPVIEGAVLFLLDFLVEDKESRYLVTSPSLSPENSYWTLDSANRKVKGTLCEGSTIDMEIVKALFRAYIKFNALSAAQLALLLEVRAALARLPPLQRGEDGRLMEWQEPYEEVEPGHRHFSHLFPLYPGDAITPSNTPELADACRKTLEHRLAHGGAHTGWSRAWLICLYARLHDGEQALKHLELMLSTSTLPNLFSSHPPMQIDGNFGACAGILEMLIQSHETQQHDSKPSRRIIRILPACPQVWMLQGGRMEGVKARGGFKLAFEWLENAVLRQSTVESPGREAAVLILPSGEEFTVPCESGKWTIGQLSSLE